MSFWVIYDHPRDYPDHIMMRVWKVVPGNPNPVPQGDARLFDNIEQARESLPKGLYNIGRYEQDDPNIAEVWI